MNLVQTSENTMVILFDQTINPDIARQVALCQRRIEKDIHEYIVDIISSYASITVVFDFRKINGESVKTLLLESLHKVLDKGSNKSSAVTKKSATQDKQIIDIPVYYDSEVGFDLVAIAEDKNITVNDVITLHTEQIYDVYAVGFAPGFAYLGSVNEQIAMPRKQTPRKHIPAGSLGIAGQQTAIYPSSSPGGWQIIGRTPCAMVDYEAAEPSRIKMGDQVRFVPISKQEYLELGGELE